MTAKELKKLKRSELLEMLLARTEEVERLRAELDEAQKKLDDRAITLENSGSIAEAALKLNGVFEAAEEAAKQYLENIERIALANAAPAEEVVSEEEQKPKKQSKSTKSKKSKKSTKSKTTDEPKAEEPKAETESAEDAE